MPSICLSVPLLKLQGIKRLHLETIEDFFDVLALLVKLLPGPDFLLDLTSPGISWSTVDVGALIDDAVENVRVGLSKVLDATSLFDAD